MVKWLIKKLGLFKHQFRVMGTGEIYGQKSTYYECQKCEQISYIPFGMQEMLLARGCSKYK